MHAEVHADGEVEDAGADKVTLMQRHWVAYVQEELDRLRASGLKVGAHAQQLRPYCEEAASACKDVEALEDLRALLAVYELEESDETRGDDTDFWAMQWRNRVVPLLCTRPVPVPVDTPDEDAITRQQLLQQIVDLSAKHRDAAKARKQDEAALHEAMRSAPKKARTSAAKGSRLPTVAEEEGCGCGNADQEGAESSAASTELVGPVHVSPSVSVDLQNVQQTQQAGGVQFQVLLGFSVFPPGARSDASTQTE